MAFDVVCYYHANCHDGFAAALVLRKFYRERAARLIPCAYGERLPPVKGSKVFFVDFSAPADVLTELAAQNQFVVVLDHHASAEEALRGLPAAPSCLRDHDPAPGSLHVLFDMSRSGAQLTWDFFHPDEPRPRMIDMIGDRDLWQFKVSGSRELHAYLAARKMDFVVWDLAMAQAEKTLSDLIFQGAALMHAADKAMRDAVSASRRTMAIGGRTVPVANVPPGMASEAGHFLCQGHPFAATYYDTRDSRKFSLRSTENGLDVRRIAEQYGGGGHRNAAGFSAPRGWEGDPTILPPNGPFTS